MTDPLPSGSSGIPFQDVLLALFKHKWKIIFLTLVGLAAAGAVFYWYVPLYESEARLLVRYVVDSTSGDSGERASAAQAQTMDGIINSEVVILTSWDLAVEVAKEQDLVRKKLVASETQGAARIQKGLTVSPIKGTNAIAASYKDRDPILAPAILASLIKVYFTKHLKVHRDSDPKKAGEEVIRVNTKLKGTEASLDTMKAAAGILSLGEGAASLTSEVSKTQEALRTALAELEEQKARVAVLGAAARATAPATSDGPNATPAAATDSPPAPKPDPVPPLPASVPNPDTAVGKAPAPVDAAAAASATPATPAPATPTATPSSETPIVPLAGNADLEEYRTLTTELAALHQSETGLLSKFQPGHVSVQAVRGQIRSLEGQRDALVERFPDLVARAPAGTAPTRQFDLASEQARLVGLQARIERLNSQLREARERFSNFGLNASEMARLERQKAVDEEAFKYVSGRDERARIDDALSPTNMPNISPVQEPSPAALVTKVRDKLVAGLAGGGLGLGIALALFLELMMNRTVKRPLELESRLHLPLMLAIPRMSRNGRARLTSGKGGKNGGARSGKPSRAGVPPWDHDHFIQPFSEVVRDRLAMFFEVNGLDHKPKLVGVAGFSIGAGASTLAGGLAAALSETGDGKVLLVDMNVGQGEAHSFFKGRPAHSLIAALESSNGLDAAAENLYLATVNPENGKPVPLGVKKFHAMMPGLKASDYDYIIFDMPPLSQTSPTMTMAPYLDKLLVVAEAEKNDRDVVKRRCSELAASKATFSIIFNKARHYGPRWLECEV